MGVDYGSVYGSVYGSIHGSDLLDSLRRDCFHERGQPMMKSDQAFPVSLGSGLRLGLGSGIALGLGSGSGLGLGSGLGDSS